MKKIISGKVYDTDTARYLAGIEDGAVNDFRWYAESLYQKKTGEFFLHGEGHAASPYSQHYSDGTRGPGEKIVPLTYEAARKWAEDNITVEKYELIFGEVAEDDSKTVLSLSVSTSAADRARRAAAEQGVSLSAYIEALIP